MAGIDYTVNTEDVTSPADNNVAKKGAAEIRALKARIIGISGSLFTAAGAVDTMTGILPTLVNGLRVFGIPVGANTSTTPTLNGIQIVKQDAGTGALVVLAAGDYNANSAFTFRYQAVGLGGVPNWVINGAVSTAEAVGTMKAWPGLTVPDTNWDWCDGGALSRAIYPVLFAQLMKTAVVLTPLAAPGVVTWTAHGLRNNHPVKFTTTGGLPTGLVAGTTYYIVNKTADTFEVAATPGGASIAFTVATTGVSTGICAPHGDGDGATTFNKPDVRGRTPVGRDDMGGTAANRVTLAESGIYGEVPGLAGGAESHQLIVAEMPAHTHTAAIQEYGDSYTSSGYHAGLGITGSTGGNGTHNNMQPSIVEDWIIRIQ